MINWIKKLFGYTDHPLNELFLKDLEIKVLKEENYRLKLHNKIYKKQLQFLKVLEEIIETPEIMIGCNNGLSQEIIDWIKQVTEEQNNKKLKGES